MWTEPAESGGRTLWSFRRLGVMTSQTRSLIPDFVSHYYLPGTRPFLNLSELSAEERPGVLLALDKRRVAGEHKRVFGSRYMDLRRRAEARLLELFEQAGGRPERTAPHYFVLGESAWYRGLAPGMQAAVLPLSELPSIVTSFTYPDSFTATGLVADFGLPLRVAPLPPPSLPYRGTARGSRAVWASSRRTGSRL